MYSERSARGAGAGDESDDDGVAVLATGAGLEGVTRFGCACCFGAMIARFSAPELEAKRSGVDGAAAGAITLPASGPGTPDAPLRLAIFAVISVVEGADWAEAVSEADASGACRETGFPGAVAATGAAAAWVRGTDADVTTGSATLTPEMRVSAPAYNRKRGENCD